jgi:hypothetical protein
MNSREIANCHADLGPGDCLCEGFSMKEWGITLIFIGLGSFVDCAPPAGEISSRFEGSVIGAFSLLNCHLEFLRG